MNLNHLWTSSLSASNTAVGVAALISLASLWLYRRGKTGDEVGVAASVPPQDRNVVIVHVFPRWNFNPDVCCC